MGDHEEPLPTIAHFVVRDVAVVRGSRRWLASRRSDGDASVTLQALREGRSGDGSTDWDNIDSAPARWQDAAIVPRPLAEDEAIDGYRFLDEIAPPDVLAELAEGLSGSRRRRPWAAGGVVS